MARPLPVKEGVDHGFPGTRPLHRAVKQVALARTQSAAHIALVKKGEGEEPGVIRRPKPSHLHPGPGPAGAGRLSDFRRHTAFLSRRGAGHRVQVLPVLIVPWKPVQQIFHPPQPQLFQPGRPGRTDARQGL